MQGMNTFQIGDNSSFSIYNKNTSISTDASLIYVVKCTGFLIAVKVTTQTFYRSTDEGLTWTDISASGNGKNIRHAVWDGTRVIIFTDSASGFYSSNGTSWTNFTYGDFNEQMQGVVKIGSTWIAVTWSPTTSSFFIWKNNGSLTVKADYVSLRNNSNVFTNYPILCGDKVLIGGSYGFYFTESEQLVNQFGNGSKYRWIRYSSSENLYYSYLVDNNGISIYYSSDAITFTLLRLQTVIHKDPTAAGTWNPFVKDDIMILQKIAVTFGTSWNRIYKIGTGSVLNELVGSYPIEAYRFSEEIISGNNKYQILSTINGLKISRIMQ